MSRLTFYDPLYDYVTFEEAERQRPRFIFDAGFSSSAIGSASKSLKPFLGSPELSRLSFLRQSDLGFLVYPSATHTRLAHAIGCCYLGYVAAREIIVGVRGPVSGGRGPDAREVVLAKWLEERGWKEEFLLALLLHDVGHFAFSHALENDREFWDAIGAQVRHEEIATQIIRGTGEAYDALGARWQGCDEMPGVSQLLRSAKEIDGDVVAFLISGDMSLIAQRDAPTVGALAMLHELTSGLLDLDRIDHYRRDSYFSGMKFASNLNFASLLGGFSIWHSSSEEAGQHEIRLSREAIGHALTLLHAKERLVHDCFENADNLAYEVMLHQAFNYFTWGDEFYRNGADGQDRGAVRKLAFELLMGTDEELLVELARCGTAKTASIVRRIRCRRPFALVSRKSWERRQALPIAELRAAIAKAAGGMPADDVVIRLGKHYGVPRTARPQEWLHLDSLADEDGFPLENHEEYRRQIEHFKKVQDDNLNVFWVFTPRSDEPSIAALRNATDAVTRQKA